MRRATVHRLWLDITLSADDELESLEETPYWDSESRRRYHAVEGPRVRQLNKANEKIYDYNDDYSGDGIHEESGDDYQEF